MVFGARRIDPNRLYALPRPGVQDGTVGRQRVILPHALRNRAEGDEFDVYNAFRKSRAGAVWFRQKKSPVSLVVSPSLRHHA